MTVAAFVVFTYDENKLFLWHFWLGHLVGKTRDEKEEKEMSEDSECLVMCVCVFMHQVGRGREIVREEK